MTKMLMTGSVISALVLTLSGCASVPSITEDNAQGFLLAPVDLPDAFDQSNREGLDEVGFARDCAPGRLAMNQLLFADALGFVSYTDDRTRQSVTQGLYRLDSMEDIEQFLVSISEATGGDCDVVQFTDDGSVDYERQYIEAQPIERVVEVEGEGVVWDELFSVPSLTSTVIASRTFVFIRGEVLVVLTIDSTKDEYKALTNQVVKIVAEKLSQ
jgi:hypothetical protein